jgi:hypothetical protein
MKLSLPILAVMLLSAPVLAADRCGDADASGAITVTDGVQILRAAAGLASSCTLARCDLDGSGTIAVTDGVNVLRDAAGLPVNLACPRPTPLCASATATVTLAVPEPIGAAVLTLAYPPTAVNLPGSGDAAADRVTILDPSVLAGGGPPNDLDDQVVFNLVTLDGLTSGPLLTVRFDCLDVAPAASRFTCVLSDVFALDAVTPIDGASCTVAVTSE